MVVLQRQWGSGPPLDGRLDVVGLTYAEERVAGVELRPEIGEAVEIKRDP